MIEVNRYFKDTIERLGAFINLMEKAELERFRDACDILHGERWLNEWRNRNSEQSQ